MLSRPTSSRKMQRILQQLQILTFVSHYVRETYCNESTHNSQDKLQKSLKLHTANLSLEPF